MFRGNLDLKITVINSQAFCMATKCSTSICANMLVVVFCSKLCGFAVVQYLDSMILDFIIILSSVWRFLKHILLKQR